MTIKNPAVLAKEKALPMFPIMGGPKVPWSLIAPYEAQAQKNHGQTLKRLAERGGLSMCEAMAIMSSVPYRDRPIAKPTVEDWLDFIAERTARASARAALSATEGEAEPVAWLGFTPGGAFVSFFRDQEGAERGRQLGMDVRAVYASPPSAPAGVKGSPDDIRALGWSVAVHNDYRLNGEQHTFWLFTKDGRAIKGEGRSDAEALDQVRSSLQPGTQAAAASAPAGDLGVETFASCGQWADETFGPATALRRLERAEEELAEAKDAPPEKLLEEMADTVICIAAAAHSTGGDLQGAIDAKMAVNRKRQWSVRGDGTGYHIPAAPGLADANSIASAPAQEGRASEFNELCDLKKNDRMARP